MPDLNLQILINAQDKASPVFSGLKNALGNITFGMRNLSTSGNVGMGALQQGMVGVGNSMWQLAGVTAMAGAAVAVGIGVKSVQAASQFQTAMDQNVAHAGLAKDQVDNVTKSLLQMGPAVGQSPTVLAQAMYPVLSSLSGISNQSAKSALALDEVKLASESVAGSTTSVTSVTNAASAAFNAYGLQTNNANTNTARMNNLFDVMNKTVSDGNMQWNVYSNAIGKLSVSSHAAGVSFNETNAALADLTNSGYSAQLGATYLGNTYNTLYTKADTVAKNAKSLGIAFDATKYKSMDLGQRLTYLRDITGDNQTKLLKLMNGNSVALKTFDALSNSIGQYKSNLNDLNHAQGGTAQAFQTASSSFGFAIQRIQAAGQSLLITIGLQLLPTLTKIASSLVPIIAGVSDWVTKSGALNNAISFIVGAFTMLVTVGSNVVSFFQHNQVAMAALQGVLITIAGFIATSMVMSFYAWATAAWAAAAGTMGAIWPLLAIGAAIAVVVGAFILAYNNIKPFRDFINGIGQWIMSTALPALRSLGSYVGGQLASGIQNAIGVIRSISSSIVDWWNKSDLVNKAIKGVGDAVTTARGIIQGTIGVITNIVNWFIRWRTPILSVAGAITAFFLPAMIQAGLKAVTSGAQVAGSFISSMIATGTQAVINAAKVTASFIASMVQSGVQAVIQAPKIIASFVASMIATGTQAVINAAKVTGSFIASLVQTGIQGWASAGKLATFIGSMIATGVQAVIAAAKVTVSFIGSMIKSGVEAAISAAKIVGSFVASLITTGIEAATTGGIMLAELVPAIISVAAEGVIAAATAIPGLIAGFIAWAATAGAAAIATIAATWPILLIIGAIALLVVGIILLVQHWGQVVSFLRGAWQGFSSWFMGALKAVGAFFTGIWNSILGFLRTAWNAIVNAAKAGAMLLLAVIIGPIGLIVLYVIQHWAQIKAAVTVALNAIAVFVGNVWNNIKNGINNALTFIKGIATTAWNNIRNTISNVLNFIGNLVTNTWNNIKNGINNALNFIGGVIRTGWTNIQNNVQNALNFIKNIVQTAWDDEVRGWTILIDRVRTVVTNLWNGVVNLFNNARTTVGNAVTNIWNGIVSIMNGWPGAALQAGAKIVNSIADGIRGAIGNVTSAMTSITDAIGKFLPHSPAEQGELSHLLEYGPNLVNGFATGIVQSIPLATDAMNQLTTPVGQALASALDPTNVAGQLSFTSAPTQIYSGTKAPVETRAVKQEQAQDKKEARQQAAEERKQAAAERKAERRQAAEERKAERAAAAAARKAAHHTSAHHSTHHAAAHHAATHRSTSSSRQVSADIKQIKAELHIHTSNTKLDHAQIQEIVDRATPQFGQAMAEQIRAQFGSI